MVADRGEHPTVSAEEARARFADIINQASYRNERTVVTKYGKGVAAIVSMADLELLETLFSRVEDRIDAEGCRVALKEIETEGAIPLERVKAELGL